MWPPVHSVGAFFPTYSGLAIPGGTQSGLEITPGLSEPVVLSRGIELVYSKLTVRPTTKGRLMSETSQYWFNIRTRQVEFGLKSSSLDRIGPFDTEDEAKNAEETIRLRSQAWLEQDKLED